MTSNNVLREFSSHLTFRSCVECSTPLCNCASDETCVESSRTCTQCPTVSCMPSATSTPSNSGGSSNAGAIAGGVVGGLAVIAIITFLFWWFVIRKRRQAQAAEVENAPRHERSRSMQSIASTVLTRASNVIQIAYIPGVTNRSPPSHNTLIPPVPPIPGNHIASFETGDQFLFTPRDLRDSRYSSASSDRRSIATSLARSSVATTIYRNDAIVSPIPAQQVRTARAAMVSVKQGGNSPTDTVSVNTTEAPPMPTITEAHIQKSNKIGPQLSSIVARSVVARPVNVKRSASKPKVPTVSEEEVNSDDSESVASHSRAKRMTGQNSKFDDSSDDESDADVNEKSESAGDSIQIAFASPSNEGPFADSNVAGTPIVTISTPPSSNTTPSAPTTTTQAFSTSRSSAENQRESTHRQRTSIGSTRMLENAISEEAVTQRSPSPFDDHHEVK